LHTRKSIFGAMEFGLVPHTELDKIDFSFPADPEANKNILPGVRAESPKVYVGLPRWGREEWVGKLYPLRTKQSDYLHYYAAHFNMIELNATHYNFFGKYRLSVWADTVGKDFKFLPKMIKDVSHAPPLIARELPLEKFVTEIRVFGEHLGPIFIQLNEIYNPKRKGDLYQFLEMLPGDLQFFLEVRHADWFTADIQNELLKKLQQYKVGYIITDTAGRRECAHMHLSIPKTFVRFVTNNGHPSDFDRTDLWAQRMKLWLDQGIEEIYFAIHMRDEEYSLDLVKYAVDKVNEVCKLNLPPVNLMN
jgi:uncharacterized protein YecE (DUF72 family)